MMAAFSRCGTVRAPRFVGRYELDETQLPKDPDDDSPSRAVRDRAHLLRKLIIDQYANFEVDARGVRSGKVLVQDLCFVDIRVQTESTLDAIALWHEDIHDPGDASPIRVRLERDGPNLRFWRYAEEKDLRRAPLVLRARP
jgi:hypothetical protein